MKRGVWALFGVAVVFAGASMRLGKDTSATVAPIGETVWQSPLAARGTAVSDARAFYFLSTDHNVVAVDRQTGDVIWSHPTGGAGLQVGGLSPRLADGILIAGDSAEISAFDATNGNQLWRFSPPDATGVGSYLGTVVEGLVATGSATGNGYGVDLRTGKVIWSVSLGENGNVVAYPPVADKNAVYFTFRGTKRGVAGGAAAVDRKSGQLIWRTALPDGWAGLKSTPTAAPALATETTVAVPTESSRVFAIDRHSGKVSWALDVVSKEFPDPHRVILGIAVSDRLFFVSSSDGVVSAHDSRNQETVWTFMAARDGSALPRMATDGRRLFVPFGSGALVALDAISGEEVWKSSALGTGFLSPPLIEKSSLFLTSRLGVFLVAYRE